MTNVLVIGKMGEGKTHFIKRLIFGRRNYVFDVNNEYDKFPNTERMTDLNDEKFLSECRKKKNTCCIFEDATGFVEGRLSDDMKRLLVSKRHTGNMCILVFHSISSVPPRILQLVDYVVLFNTEDEIWQVKQKYPSILSKFMKLWKKKKKHDFVIIKK